MATTRAGRRLTEAHRVAQSRIGAALTVQLRQAWSLLDPFALDATSQAWSMVAQSLVYTANQQSAALAAEYLDQFADAEGHEPPDIERVPLDPTAVASSLNLTGPVKVKEAIRAGRTISDAMDLGDLGSSRSGKRHALSGGFDLITGAVDNNRSVKGYARVTSGKTCAFCAMLASRGPVYTSRDRALGRRRHDGCDCTVEPVYERSAAWPPGSQEMRDLYDRVTRGQHGTDALNAFRRALT